jgi:hypothetical protein
MRKSKPESNPLRHAPQQPMATARGIVAIAALLIALSASCATSPQTSAPAPISSAIPTAIPTATLGPGTIPAQPTDTPTEAMVLLEDDFSDPQSGWDRRSDADAEWDYRDGEYRIAVSTPDLAVWSNMSEPHDWADLAVTVDARRVEGPLDNQYGMIVRYQDQSNFYLFSISSDGMFTVQMLRDDEWIDLVTWTASEAVRQGEATNTLRVECDGTHMRFFVNDKLLTEGEDDTFPSGGVGLMAGSFEEGNMVVHFDNLLVRGLPKS